MIRRHIPERGQATYRWQMAASASSEDFMAKTLWRRATGQQNRPPTNSDSIVSIFPSLSHPKYELPGIPPSPTPDAWELDPERVPEMPSGSPTNNEVHGNLFQYIRNNADIPETQQMDTDDDNYIELLCFGFRRSVPSSDVQRIVAFTSFTTSEKAYDTTSVTASHHALLPSFSPVFGK